MTGSEFNLVMAAVSHMLQEAKVHVAEDGVAVGGSWSAIDDASKQIYAGTIQVTIGKTAAILGPQNDQYDKSEAFAKPRVDVATMAPGDQYAPRGGEVTILVPTESMPVAMFMHTAVTTDAALKPGERSIRHFKAGDLIDVGSTPTVDSYIKFKNHGVATGDGKGSILMLAAALLKIITTGGTSFVMDDATGTIQMQGSGTVANDGLVRKSDLQAAINALAASVQSGSGVAPPNVTASIKTFSA